MLLSSSSLATGLIFPSLSTAQSQEESLKYKVGEEARETIVAKETIRVKDVEIGSDQFSEARNAIPSIYGYRKASITAKIQALEENWNKTREIFLLEVEKVFGKRVFRSAETNSEAFIKLIDGFRERNQEFPITVYSAKSWARGEDNDEQIRLHITEFETFMTSYFIVSEKDLKSDSSNIPSVDIITVNPIETISLADLRNQQVPKIVRNQLIPESKAKELFLTESKTRNKLTRTYLAGFVTTNTEFMENLSIERWVSTRDNVKSEIVFEKGEIIVSKGDTITPVIKEALDLMIIGMRFSRLRSSVKIELAKENQPNSSKKDTEKMPPVSPPQREMKEPVEERPKGKLPPLLGSTTVAQSDKTSQATRKSSAATPNGNPSFISSFYLWFFGLGIITVVLILVVLHFRKSPTDYINTETPALIQDDRKSLIKALSSQLTQTLFRQRQQLLKSKETATAQVAAMENRIAKLQPEIFDKLKAYEDKIKDLEEQLRQRGVTIEALNQAISSEEDQEDKEVPFPGHDASHAMEEEEPTILMEEVLEDMEAENNFEKKIAKGFES